MLNITMITTQDYTWLFTLLDDESDHHNCLRTIAREAEGERGFSHHFTTIDDGVCERNAGFAFECSRHTI